jgi:uncharacterized membrane-anchored protein YhcB (DUF1043 family)
LTQAKEITRSDECEKLKEKSKNIQLKLNNLKFNLDNRNDKIETHCLELIAQIDELAEQKIEEINKIRESLSKKVIRISLTAWFNSRIAINFMTTRHKMED